MIAKSDVAGVILAGGRSSRMAGRDKILLPLAGRPLIAHAIERLAPQVGCLAINANGDPSRFGRFHLPVLTDPIEGFAGPLAGVLAGMEWASAQTGVSHIATVAGDTPLFPGDLVARLIEAADHDAQPIAMAASDGNRHPVFALWPLALRNELAHFLATDPIRKVTAFAERHGVTVVDFPLLGTAGPQIDPFLNINTPSDFESAEALWHDFAP